MPSEGPIAIIGAGLVGTLNSIFFAKNGYTVDLFEGRQDLRKLRHSAGRSINLALSYRGRQALRRVGIEDVVMDYGIPMYARMLHDRKGNTFKIPYGKPSECIYSVDRRRLNTVLLAEADEYTNVTLHFEHRLESCDFETGELTFNGPTGIVKRNADLIIGNDGAFSVVRREMLKEKGRFNYSQEFLDHSYMELTISPNIDDNFAMDSNCLHIWPRDNFMMIALPNKDCSFTVTLFMPQKLFDDIVTEQNLIEFFEANFPDALALMGERDLKEIFFNSKPQFLVSVKCEPYHYGKGVIMGDAAHAMVPFYGQGMNAGYEDCLVFHDLLKECKEDFDLTLQRFSDFRVPDAHAISHLAMLNYIEMRHYVNTWSFLLRKKVDSFLFWMLPNTWIPLYTMVSFTRMRYSECVARREWQDKVIERCRLVAGVTLALATSYVLATNAAWLSSSSRTVAVQLKGILKM